MGRNIRISQGRVQPIMTFRVLIMGLPGAGKTTLSADIAGILFWKTTLLWLNGDSVREKYNDWDFSVGGRIRQSERMRQLADESDADVVIADFGAPLEIMRSNFAANLTVWVDTISESVYLDTNTMFVKPAIVDIHITEQDSDKWGNIVADRILLMLQSNK
jgi:adenylylsulfate kinase-like enzyme